jgi:hypothetical protein
MWRIRPAIVGTCGILMIRHGSPPQGIEFQLAIRDKTKGDNIKTFISYNANLTGQNIIGAHFKGCHKNRRKKRITRPEHRSTMAI